MLGDGEVFFSRCSNWLEGGVKTSVGIVIPVHVPFNWQLKKDYMVGYGPVIIPR